MELLCGDDDDDYSDDNWCDFDTMASLQDEFEKNKHTNNGSKKSVSSAKNKKKW